MDPLTDILAITKPVATVSRRLAAGGRWALAFGPHQGIKFMVLERGSCLLAFDGADPVRVRKGDCFLLATGRPFRMASDRQTPAEEAEDIYNRGPPGSDVHVGQGDDFASFGLRFSVDTTQARHLFGAFPPLVHLRARDDHAQLHWSLDRIAEELREPRPGGGLVARYHAQLLLIQALRLYLEQGPADGGWLAALADPRLSRAIKAMHADPARRWTVASLAAEAGLSRTAFALRFRAAAGRSPIDYLAHWRMALAAERIAAGRETASAVADALGYASESAFGAAYRRIVGRSIRDSRG